MHFLVDYSLFLAKLLSVAILFLLVVGVVLGLASKEKNKKEGTLTIEPLDEIYARFAHKMLEGMADKQKIRAWKKTKAKGNKAAYTRSLYVIHFDGDIRASAISSLRQEITAILLVADPVQDEVLVCLDSSGGLVNAYGLATSQLIRIKNAGIKLTISVDKVAASGGYMMACIADRIIAAPFAIIGSIGVVAQMPNFYDFLKERNIHYEQITAGEYKRTLSMLGKNTNKGREKVQEEVEETHQLFKKHISLYRPQVHIHEVATGEHWYGAQARDLQLVDELCTSDDYLLKKSKDTRIFMVGFKIKKNLSQRFMQGVQSLLYRHGVGFK